LSRRLIVLPEAEAELAAAAEWYESKRVGLGLDFIATVDVALAEVLACPDRFPLWREDRPYRKCLLRRFPFAIFHAVSGDDIVVVAFAHAKRRPGYWLDRVR
jgi:toxin ParE1/3/4